MTGTHTLAWGSTRPGRHHLTVTTVEELTAALNRIEADAQAAGLPQQADLWAGTWSTGEPTPDPLVQVLLGHPQRACLIWQHAGDIEYAIDPELPPPGEPVVYEGGGQADELEPDWARLTPTAARTALATFLTTGHRPDTGLTWTTPEDR